MIVLYDDLGYAATRPRRSSVASAFNGYEPILPLVLEEKGMFLRQRDSVVSRSLGWAFQTIGTRAEERRVERGAAGSW